MTPYDTALRVERRGLDEVRLSISVVVEHVTRLEAQGQTIDAQVRNERATAALEGLPHDAWAARMRAERARIASAAAQAEARLATLRAQAVEAYGTVRAIECAAERYTEESERAAATAEQSFADDLVGARFARMLQSQRRRQ